MKKLYLLRFLSICAFIALSCGLIDGFLISEAKTSVQLSDDRYNCQGCKCGRPYESDVCTHGDVSICCNMIQALEDEQTKYDLEIGGNFVVDDNLVDIDLDKGDPISFNFEIQCVDADGHKIDESNCNPATKPTSCDIPDITPIEKKYTVQFDCNGGSNPPSNQTFTVGKAGKLNANTCTRTSPWSFKGWSKAKLGTKEYDDQATVDLGGTANSTIILYAVWQRTITPTLCPDGCFYAAAVDQCFKNSCFIAGTKVRMADGSEKNIEDISEGEMVLGANGEYNTVQGLHMPKLGSKKLWSINGGKNFFTEEHPFMTTEGWKAINSELAMQEIDLEVGELQVGDVLVTNNGYVVIKSLEGVEGDKDTQLYNLMLDGDHTYYADDYLVHNKQRMMDYADGGSCPRGTELRGDGCCPSNMWGKNNECVPLCGEDDDEPTPSTTTYHWTCVEDSSQGSCSSRNSAFGNVPCNKSTEYDCYQCYVPQKESNNSWGNWALPTRIEAYGNASNYPATVSYNGRTWHRCCNWSSSVAKCQSSKGTIVSDSLCDLPKKDCTGFKNLDGGSNNGGLALQPTM